MPENTLFAQSHLVTLKKKDLKLYDKLKSFLEDKQYSVFFNEHCKDTYLPLSTPNRENLAVGKIFSYYSAHLPSVTVKIISNDLEFYLQNSGLLDHLPVYFPSQKEIYPDHVPLELLIPQIKTGVWYEGVLHILRNDITKAWVSVTKGVQSETQVTVLGLDINRAIDGDIVAIEILSGMEIDQNIELDEGVEIVVTTKPFQKPLPSIQGKVVGIIKRKYKHYCGSIRRSYQKFENKELCFFSPINPKIPEIKLFCVYPERLENKRVLVEINSCQP